MKGWWVAIALSLAPRVARAAPASDPWVPGGGNVGIGLASGVPFLVMGELSIGLTDYAAFGVLGGTTPIVSGFGFRPRGALPITAQLRILVSAPTLYYPPTSHSPAWWLSRPAALIDVEPTSGVHLGLGGGFVGIMTHDRVFGDGTAEAFSPYGAAGEGRTSDGWGTVNAFSSLAISDRASVFAEGMVVLSTTGLAGKDWIGGPPFALLLGVSSVL